jgi:hypothetical protein
MTATRRLDALAGAAPVTADSIRTGMDVYDYDGGHVGSVKEVFDTTFLVGRRWRRDIQLPLKQILVVLDRRLVLTVPRQQAGGT